MQCDEGGGDLRLVMRKKLSQMKETITMRTVRTGVNSKNYNTENKTMGQHTMGQRRCIRWIHCRPF